MIDEELKILKWQLNNEITILKHVQKLFKRRVCTMANLIVAGIGFILYGSSYLKGLISFVLFVSYNFLYFNMLSHLIGEMSIAILYYIPAVIIWAVSTMMVASLDD